MTICYTHRSMSCLSVIREFSPFSRLKYRDPQADNMQIMETWGHSALKGMSPSNTPPRGSRKPLKEKAGRV